MAATEKRGEVCRIAGIQLPRFNPSADSRTLGVSRTAYIHKKIAKAELQNR
jgi:hypothetical protein